MIVQNMNIQFNRLLLVCVNNITHNFAKIIDTYTHSCPKTIEFEWNGCTLKSALIAAHHVYRIDTYTSTTIYRLFLRALQAFRITDDWVFAYFYLFIFYSYGRLFSPNEKKKQCSYSLSQTLTQTPNIPFNRSVFLLISMFVILILAFFCYWRAISVHVTGALQFLHQTFCTNFNSISCACACAWVCLYFHWIIWTTVALEHNVLGVVLLLLLLSHHAVDSLVSFIAACHGQINLV